MFWDQRKGEEQDDEIDDKLGDEDFLRYKRLLYGQFGDQLDKRADDHEQNTDGFIFDYRPDEKDAVQHLHNGQLNQKVFGKRDVSSVVHAQLIILAINDVPTARCDHRVQVDQQLDEQKYDANAFGEIEAGLVHFDSSLIRFMNL